MRKNRKRERKPKKSIFNPLKLILFFFILLAFVTGFFYWRKIIHINYFKIDKIDSNIELERSLNKTIKGKSIFNLDIENIYKKLRDKHPEFKKIEIQKVFPSTLKIKIVKREPFAQIKKDGFYLIDEEYMVLNRTIHNSYEDLLIIELGDYPGSIREGKFMRDKRLTLACRLIRELKNNQLMDKFEIKNINASSISSISFFINDVNIIVGGGDYRKKLFLLNNLLENKFDNDISMLSYIDLRYASSSENIYIGNKR